MNIQWDNLAREFVAEFSSDFQGDLEAVKEAGFRTNGPPEWRWHAPAPGIKALNRLRKNRPASGLIISPEAFEVYKPLAEMEAKNDEVRAKLAEIKKQQKKVEKEAAKSQPQIPEGKMYIEAADLPPMPPYVSSHTIPDVPFTGICLSCGSRLYFYESKDLCLWCEKHEIKLDNVFGI